MRYFVIFMVLVGLVACDQVSTGNAGPYYVLQEDQFYGYELDTGEVVMLAFLGYRDGLLQLMEKNNQYTAKVYECGNPCPYMKVYNISTTGAPQIIETTRLKTSPDMLAFIAMEDAAAGRLSTYVNSRGQHIWVSKEGPVTIPVAENLKSE